MTFFVYQGLTSLATFALFSLFSLFFTFQLAPLLAPDPSRRRVELRRIGALFVILITAIAYPTDAVVVEPGWRPCPLPADIHGDVAAKLLLITRAATAPPNRLTRARAAARHVVADAPNGTYVILASGGATLQVIGDRFLFDGYDRQILFDAIEKVTAQPHKTDLNEVDGFVRDIQAQLKDQFGSRGVNLAAEILTSSGSMPLIAAPESSRSALRLVGQPATVTSLGDGLALLHVTLPYPVVQPVAGTPVTRAFAASPTALPTMLPAAPARQSGPPLRRAPAIGAIVAVATVLSIALAIRARRRHRAVRIEKAGDDADVMPANMPHVLTVTERDHSGDKTTVLRDRDQLPVALDAAVAFGSDAESCTYLITPLPGFEGGELFRVTPTTKGTFRVHATDGVTCNGMSVGVRGVTVAQDRPLHVRLGSREWTIGLELDRGESAAVDALFARVRSTTAAEIPSGAME